MKVPTLQNAPRLGATPENDEVILVTSTIRPADEVPFVALRDPRERLFQTLCGLMLWIETTPLQHIVVCDNSDSGHELKAVAGYAEAQGKKMEVLSFRGDAEKARSQGKGYGEGEIVAHALDRSALLRNCRTFYKITGRTFVENFNLLHEHHRKDVTVFALGGSPWENWLRGHLLRTLFFRRRWRYRAAFTVFYKSSPDFFRRHLIDCHSEVDDRRARWLEHTYYPASMTYGRVSFFQQPVVVGQSGSTGKNYSSRLYSEETQRRARDMM